MVFAKKKYDPNVTQATVSVTLTTSPTLSLSNPDATLDVTLRLRIADSPHSNEPITILLHRSAFEVFGDEGVDIFARGAFGAIRAVDDGNEETDKKISLGFFRVNEVMKSDALDLRERGCEFLTIPGDGTEVAVTHELNWKRIFKHEEKLSKDDLKPGERFRIGLNENHVGASWWCFGDLEGDLKDKKFHQWTTDQFGEEKPDDDFLRQGNWVLGRDPRYLYWKVTKDDEKRIFKIVE